MSQTACERRHVLAPMRWLHAGGDLSRHNHANPSTPIQVAWRQLRAHHHGRRENQIPIALAAQPAPNFPRLRALALFGRRPPECEAPLVIPASKNLHKNQTFFHPFLEQGGVHRPVVDPRRRKPSKAQTGMGSKFGVDFTCGTPLQPSSEPDDENQLPRVSFPA